MRSTPLGERLNPLEGIALGLLLFLSGIGILALILAEAGAFSLPLLLIASSIVLSGVALWQWRRRPFKLHWGPVERGEWIGVAVLVVSSWLIFAHPAEYVVGGGDAGVYVNLGANIARTGALLAHDPLTAALPLAQRPGFLRAQPAPAETEYLRFPGFYLSETDDGELIPQFYALHPIWLAIGYSVGGLWGALQSTPLWAVLGVLAVYVFARVLLTWPAALVAAAMLALNPLQIYFARYPTAEPLTQYFTWMGLWCFTNFVTYRPHRPLWGLTAGLALGQIFLARIDALPMLLLPGAWLCYLFVSRRWRWDEAWFWGSYAAVTLLAFFHGFWYSLPYTFNSYSVVFALAPRYFWLAAIGFILVIGGTAWLRKRLTRGVTDVQRLFMGRPVRVTAVALLALLVIYGYFIRPQLGAPSLVDYWYAQVQIPISDHENLVRLGWYLTPLGIVLATAGFGVLIMFGPWRFLWPWAIIGGVFTFLYLFAILNNPLQIYAMRRYVPVVLPSLVLAAAVFLAWLWELPWHPLLARGAAVLCGATWLAGVLLSGRLIWTQVEYAGVSRQIEALAARFPANAVLLFVDPAPVGLGVVVGTPLHFLHDHPAYDLQEELLTPTALLGQIRRWQQSGYAPYILSAPGAAMPLTAGNLEALGSFQITYPFLEQSYEHPPSFVRQVDLPMDIYAVSAPQP